MDKKIVTQQLCIRLPVTMISALEKRAEQGNRRVSDEIRGMIDICLATPSIPFMGKINTNDKKRG